MTDIIATALLIGGAFFFLAGTAGLLRFPDVYSRLHALTKADNVGIGLICAGLAIESGSLVVAAKLFLTWLLVLLASATVAHIIARAALDRGIQPWKK